MDEDDMDAGAADWDDEDGEDFDDDDYPDSDGDLMEYDEKDDHAQATFLSPDDVSDLLGKSVMQVCEVTGVARDHALMVLMAHSWNREDCLADMLEDPSKALAKAGGSEEGGAVQSTEVGECAVCMEDEGALMSLRCEHWACTGCWAEHVTQQLENRHCSVGCIGMGCPLALPESDLLGMASEATIARYRKLQLESFISCRSNLKWCPTPDCGVVVRAEYGGAVECRSCHESFCFKCGTDHFPASCANMKSFLAKNASESKDVLWLVNNAKECPKCTAFIEKRGGCNWMKCVHCKYEFCWLCFKAIKHGDIDAAGGSHRCNKFNGEIVQEAGPDGKALSNEAAERRKLAHFLSRYDAHKKSAELEQKALGKGKSEVLSARATVKMLVQSQKEAIRQLRTARLTLCSSYVYGFYEDWESVGRKNIFEDLQHLLESRTEALSHAVQESITFLSAADVDAYTESDSMAVRERLMRNQAAVATNRRNLISACAESSLDS